MVDLMYPNIYEFGQCTWGAANLENWVLRYGNLGNALDWAQNWRDHGGFVQMTPAVGLVACFQPGSNDADVVFGHVAVVINITALKPQHFTVDEMNGPRGPGHYDDRVCIDGPGVSFLVQSNPTPSPSPTPQGEPVFIAQGPTNIGNYLVFENGATIPIGAPTTSAALAAQLKLQVIVVDQTFAQNCAAKATA
jgi:surface antigen